MSDLSSLLKPKEMDHQTAIDASQKLLTEVHSGATQNYSTAGLLGGLDYGTIQQASLVAGLGLRFDAAGGFLSSGHFAGNVLTGGLAMGAVLLGDSIIDKALGFANQKRGIATTGADLLLPLAALSKPSTSLAFTVPALLFAHAAGRTIDRYIL